MLTKLVIGMALGGLILGTSLAGAAQTADGCRDAKLKATSKKMSAILKAIGKNEKSPDLAKMEDAIAKAKSKFSDAMTKTEAKGGCDITGDAPAIESVVDTDSADLGCQIGAQACDCGATQWSKFAFTTVAGSGNCGEVDDGTPTKILDLACNGLYFGGGVVPNPLPTTVPDYGSSIYNVCCVGKFMHLTGTTPAQSGSSRNCTVHGCLYGPPLPVLNAATPAISTCIINNVANDADGTVQCDTGAQSINIPLNSTIFLTGDAIPGTCDGTSPVADQGKSCSCAVYACAAAPCNGGMCQQDTATEPCPICSTTTNKCVGGPNNNKACTGISAIVDPKYPTSHDCPPSSAVLVGILPIPYALTTSSVTRTESTGTFCGFCNDADGTGAFENPPRACTSNAGCSQPFENCQQKNAGAFNNAPARTIKETGVAPATLTNGALNNETLVSIFCIPPTFNATIDNSAGLPGPGAVSLQGQGQLLP